MYMRVKHRPFYRVVAETWSASATRGFLFLGSEEGKPPGRGAFAPMNLVFPRVLTWALGGLGDDRESRKVPIGSPRTLLSDFPSKRLVHRTEGPVRAPLQSHHLAEHMKTNHWITSCRSSR